VTGRDGDPADHDPVKDEQGADPDYRFSMANERTVLAWLRTSLALFASAVAVDRLLPSGTWHDMRHALAAVLALIGLMVSCGSYLRWRATERAMRLGLPLPRPWLLFAVSGSLLVVGLGVLLLVLTA
jgi:putative membrane protein